jgi:AcrR family transcriptional regulator
MNSPPPPLARLFQLGERREPDDKPSLSLVRIVAAGIELADGDGLGAVSMARVAERLGFTTMSLYRHVDSKDELLLLMMNAAMGTPSDPDAPIAGWRDGLERWAWEILALIKQHPWAVRVPLSPVIGPGQLAWLDYGLRSLADTHLTEQEKANVILLLNGYVFWQARLLEEIGEPPGGAEAPGSYSEMLKGLLPAERYPALHRGLDAGIFDDYSDPDEEFKFGLERVLDGIGRLVDERARGGGERGGGERGGGEPARGEPH